MKNKIKFTPGDQDFLRELNTSVDNYFKDNGRKRSANNQIYIKTALLAFCYLATYLSLYNCQNLYAFYWLYILLGPLTVFLALNIGHEAAHNIYSRNNKINNWLVYTFDFLGASGLIWKHKHVDSHHLYTNIHEVDLELKQPNIVRIFPQSPFRFFHKAQHLYMPFLYSIYTLVWFCFRDFKDYFLLRHQLNKGQMLKADTQFLSFKTIFIFRMIILPALFLPFSWLEVLSGFILSNIAASMTVSFALISTHVGEHSSFPVPNEDGRLPHSWIRHQFLTTSDFATSNSLVTALYGGFNHHLTHHLFPFVSHVHYPSITKIVHTISKKYNIDLFPQPTIIAAIGSHFKLLKARATQNKEPLEWMEM